MIRLMQPIDLSSSNSSILCLLPIISVCLPLATDNKTFEAHTFGVYPFGELATDILLCLALTNEFEQGGTTKRTCTKIEAKVHKRIELSLGLAYTKVVDIFLTW